MLFSSYTFLWLFLPLLLVTYYLIPRNALVAKNILLLFASWMFYIWGSGLHFLILLFDTLLAYWVSKQLVSNRGDLRKNINDSLGDIDFITVVLLQILVFFLGAFH